MIPVFVISDNRQHPGQVRLRESLIRHGWQYFEIEEPFQGWGYKIMRIRQLIDQYPQFERFIVMDGFDTYAVAGPGEIPESFLTTTDVIASAEKGCYPHPEKAAHFSHYFTPWRYPNAGQVFIYAPRYVTLTDRIGYGIDGIDQIWHTDRAIEGETQLDWQCDLFQSIAFEAPGDFTLENGRVINNVTLSRPLLLHGNGRTPLDKFYEL